MRRALALGLAAAALLGCGSERRDWRITPCEGESAESCRVEEIEVDGQLRTFVVSHPPDAACAAGALPVVFAWHGSGGNGAQLRSYLGLEEALNGAAFVLYPDGLPHPDSGGFTGWDRDPDGRDVRFFDALLGALGDEPCLDASRVFSVGHSRGGRFVEVLACHRSDSHLALAMIAAGAWNVTSCPGSAPLWLSHGRDDGTVGFWQARLVRSDWAERNECSPVSWLGRYEDGRCTALAGCPEETPVVWCPHDETVWDGHGIPSFAPAEIANFFGAFSKPGR